jgi:hypothetical protein
LALDGMVMCRYTAYLVAKVVPFVSGADGVTHARRHVAAQEPVQLHRAAAALKRLPTLLLHGRLR